MTALDLQRKRAIRKFLKTNKPTQCPVSYGEPYTYAVSMPYYTLGATK